LLAVVVLVALRALRREAEVLMAEAAVLDTQQLLAVLTKLAMLDLVAL
jgi:hypothetical protein